MKIREKLHGAKNFILGMVTMALVFALVMSVSAQVRTRNVTITYDNIRITIDGRETPLTDLQGRVIEPFLMDGTMFVPISPLVRQFGKTSTYDASTRTLAIRTVPTAGTPVPLAELRVSATSDSAWRGANEWVDNSGVTRRNVLYIGANTAVTRGSRNYSLNGEFTNITGVISVRNDWRGRSGTMARVRIFGDNDMVIFESSFFSGETHPETFNVNVAGVNNLRIEITSAHIGLGISDVIAYRR